MRAHIQICVHTLETPSTPRASVSTQMPDKRTRPSTWYVISTSKKRARFGTNVQFEVDRVQFWHLEFSSCDFEEALPLNPKGLMRGDHSLGSPNTMPVAPAKLTLS